MDIRTFAVAAKMEEIGHRVKLDIERMAKMAEFDSKMCFVGDEDAKQQFELAAQKLREASDLFANGATDLMAGYSKLKNVTDDEREVLNKYIKDFHS